MLGRWRPYGHPPRTYFAPFLATAGYASRHGRGASSNYSSSTGQTTSRSRGLGITPVAEAPMPLSFGRAVDAFLRSRSLPPAHLNDPYSSPRAGAGSSGVTRRRLRSFQRVRLRRSCSSRTVSRSKSTRSNLVHSQDDDLRTCLRARGGPRMGCAYTAGAIGRRIASLPLSNKPLCPRPTHTYYSFSVVFPSVFRRRPATSTRSLFLEYEGTKMTLATDTGPRCRRHSDTITRRSRLPRLRVTLTRRKMLFWARIKISCCCSWSSVFASQAAQRTSRSCRGRRGSEPLEPALSSCSSRWS